MQSSKTTTLAPILLLLAIGTAPQYSLASIDGDTLRTMAEALPMEVEIRGRFLFAPVPVSGIASDVFVCEVGHAQSGGRFCFATTNETFHILEAKDGGIMDVFQVLKDEWYVLSESAKPS